MKSDFRSLRVRQLARSLSSFDAAKKEPRPQHGWLRAIREGLGLSLEDVGKKLGQSRRRVQEFEKAESQDRITLRSLKRVAAGLGCELVYAIIPKNGTITELAERRARDRDDDVARATAQNVRNVAHTMALENQSMGNVDELIEDETKRRNKR
jgi:predicted DNA-binding mobile mystery protein A